MPENEVFQPENEQDLSALEGKMDEMVQVLRQMAADVSQMRSTIDRLLD